MSTLTAVQIILPLWWISTFISGFTKMIFLFLSIMCPDLLFSGHMSCVRPGNLSFFLFPQSIGSLSHCVVSLMNLLGVISTKIRPSIMNNYCQACGPHSVFALPLTPALRHATPVPSHGWEGAYMEKWKYAESLALTSSIGFLSSFPILRQAIVNFISSLIHCLVGLSQIEAT